MELTLNRMALGPSDESSFRWVSILGGAICAVSIWILLTLLGMAIGLTSVDPSHPGGVKASGLFTGIWGLVAPLVALFIGGMLAARTTRPQRWMDSARQGLAVWAITTLGGVVLVGWILSSVIGGAVAAGRDVIQAGGNAVAAGVSRAEPVGRALGLDANDALGPVNARLRAEGKPEVTAEQLQSATGQVIASSVRQGRVDRSMLVQALADKTALTDADADEVATRIETQLNAAKANAGQAFNNATQQVQTGALKEADATGKAMGGLSAALLLGLICAVLGAVVATPRAERLRREQQPAARLREATNP